MKSALWLLFFLALSLAARVSNYADVFTGGQIYFVDADCYSRMTRVQMVLAHPGEIIRHHDFENYPQGTDPHTTAPFDYLVAALALVLRPFAKNYADLAGAIVSPLLGLMTTAFLWYWSRELIHRFRKVMMLLASISPILVHGTSLGRPDHQSVLIFLMAVALGAELAMARTPSVKWGVVAGIAWALGLWVSFYEPLILMVTILCTKLAFFRSQLFARERRAGNLIFLAILVLMLLVERWHVTMPDETMQHYLPQWFKTVGEMKPVWKLSEGGVLHSLLFSWVGFGLLVAPLLLIARIHDAKRSIILLALLVVTFSFTLGQSRWGYFFALIFAMSLPWQLSLFARAPQASGDEEKTRSWLKPAAVWCIFVLSLWPVLSDWDARLYPDENRAALLTQKRMSNIALRDVADHLRSPETLPVLAPWWLCPALVYWSGQPAIAGSSHEGLSGIVDSARFYTAPDFETAQKIVQRRSVRAVVLSEPTEIIATSAALLFQPLQQTTVAQLLYEHPHQVPPWLQLIYNQPNFFKIFGVSDSALNK